MEETLATARQQHQSARAAGLPKSCINILQEEVRQEDEAMKKAQPLGQKMDQARASFKWACQGG